MDKRVSENLKRVNEIVYDIGLKQKQQEEEEVKKLEGSTQSNDGSTVSAVVNWKKMRPKHGTLDFSYNDWEDFANSLNETEVTSYFESIPASSLEQLFLQFNDLHQIPTIVLKWMPSFSSLRELDLSHNHLKDLQYFESPLNTSATEVPLPQLELFIASHNHLKSFIVAKFVMNFCGGSNNNLKVVDLSHNKIEKISNFNHDSKVACLFKNLHQLLLNHNSICMEEVENFFKTATFVGPSIDLHLEHNRLEGIFPVSMLNTFSSGVSKFYAHENKISNFDMEQLDFSVSKTLQIINLGYNSIKNFTLPGYDQFPSLIELHLNHNQLNTLLVSDNSSKPLMLKCLSLQYNQLKDISSIAKACHLEQLEEFPLNNNLIETLDETMVSKLKSVQVLYLQSNMLKTLPSTLSHLTQLVELDLFQNHLQSIEEGVLGKLTNLKRLCLDDNRSLESLPNDIVNLSQLYYFSAHNTPKLKTSPFIAAMLSDK